MSKFGLSTNIKHLLTLRNPGPPAISSSILNDLFSRTLKNAKERKAETGWLVLTTCSLLTANRPSALAHLYRFVSSMPTERTKLSSSVNKAAIMREAALKATIFVGVPRVILSLAAPHEALEEEVKHALRKESRRTISPENLDATHTRGKALWSALYEPYAEKLHEKIGSYHPDFIHFITQCYGSVLAPLPGHTKSFYDASSLDDGDQGNLSRAMGSIVGIACLRAEGDVMPQLTSHVFGLLKARYVESQNGEDTWLSSDEGTEWVIRTVDEILDALATPGREKIEAKL